MVHDTGFAHRYWNDLPSIYVLLATHDANYTAMKNTCVHNVVQLVKGFSGAENVVRSEIVKVVRWLIVMPAANAVSEWSFSAMRRIKKHSRMFKYASRTAQCRHSLECMQRSNSWFGSLINK